MADTPTDGRALRGDQTRLALLRAARVRFAAAGYAGASVRDIAREAGVNAALVGYHFGGKEALYRAAIAEAMSELRDRVVAAFLAVGNPEDAAQAALGAYLDHLEADPAFPRLIVRGLLDGDAVVRELLREHLSPVFGLPGVRDVLDDGLTVYAAAVAPYLYGPLLADLTGEDPYSPEARDRWRRHLGGLIRKLGYHDSRG